MGVFPLWCAEWYDCSVLVVTEETQKHQAILLFLKYEKHSHAPQFTENVKEDD